MGKFDGVCGETLFTLTDEIVAKLFNSLADTETKNAGKEVLETWTKAGSFVSVIMILPEVL